MIYEYIDLGTPIVQGLYDATLDLAYWMQEYGIALLVGVAAGWMLYSAKAARWRVNR